MKKLMVILLPIFILFSCTSSVEDDLINYIDISLPPLSKAKIEAISPYEKALLEENYTYESLYFILSKDVIPKYSEFINSLENISIVTDEVDNLHKIYKKAANTQYEGLIMLKDGLKKKNNKFVEDANTILRHSAKYQEEFYNELHKLMKKYDIN